MAVQIPDPGTGNGQTGDNEYVFRKKVKDNFSDQTNAASRLIGSANGQVPLSENVHSLARQLAVGKTLSSTYDIDTMPAGDSKTVVSSEKRAPYMSSTQIFSSISYGNDSETNDRLQVATTWPVKSISLRNRNPNGDWSDWTPITTHPATYEVTTATNPNVVVESDGTLKRSSSSAKYKEVISELELDDDLYQKAMQVNPIVYRSKAEGDPKDWHYLSFLAEGLGELDPSLTQWRTHEYNEDGERVELEEKEAEGINLNAICAVLHATNIYQDKKLRELEQRLTALESNNEPIE